MSSMTGKNIKISIFGQSHAPGIGVVIDGLPAGRRLDLTALGAFLARRAPGGSKISTQRKEADLPEFLSGLKDGVTCGAPLAAVIRNTDTRSSDYDELMDIPRPAHADYTAQLKYKGAQDVAGGGHFSGRLTAPLCIAGGICLQLLEKENIHIAAHIASIGTIYDAAFDPVNISPDVFPALRTVELPVLDQKRGKNMLDAIEDVRKQGDSLGGVVECAAVGVPGGLGDPIFDGMENRIASLVFGIPAVKGIEFGSGFAGSSLTGSENNDGFRVAEDGTVRTCTNNHGGILGGITSGMPILFRAAFKPTPSIAKEQNSVSLSKGENVKLRVKGRHDPCIVPRAVPCVEAAAAIAIFDALLDV